MLWCLLGEFPGVEDNQRILCVSCREVLGAAVHPTLEKPNPHCNPPRRYRVGAWQSAPVTPLVGKRVKEEGRGEKEEEEKNVLTGKPVWGCGNDDIVHIPTRYFLRRRLLYDCCHIWVSSKIYVIHVTYGLFWLKGSVIKGLVCPRLRIPATQLIRRRRKIN